MIKYKEFENSFAEIWRVYISGSSESGKTKFAETLLKSDLIKYDRLYYFHPDIHEESPVDWHKTLDVPVIYQAGLPTESDLLDIPRHSCIVLDDLFSEACKVKHVDYLFRVLSSKHKLNVIIMTQRYFSEGDIGRSIRNSSNYHVLLRNADERTNAKVGTFMDLKKDFLLANKLNSRNPFPYIFIDRTKFGRLSGIFIYIDLFSKYKFVIKDSMPSYILSEADFKKYFSLTEKNLAEKNENQIRETTTRKSKQNNKSASDAELCRAEKRLQRTRDRQRERRLEYNIQRKVRKTLLKHKIRPQL